MATVELDRHRAPTADRASRWFGSNAPGDALLAQRAFVFLSVFFGLTFAFLNPPYQVDDEYAHMWRVYELSTGKLLSDSDASGPYEMYPAAGMEHLKRYKYLRKAEDRHFHPKRLLEDLHQPWSEQPLVRVAGYAANYSPVNYLPQIVVLRLARALALPPLLQLYGVRLASLAAYIALASRAIWWAGMGRWVVLVVALMPMALWQAAGVSADGITNGLALAVFAWWLALRRGHNVLTRREIVVTGLLCAALALCKFIYAGLLVLFMALPAARFGGSGRRWTAWSGWALAALLPLCGWMRLNASLGSTNSRFDAGRQLDLLVDEPSRLVSVLWHSWRREAWLYAQSFVGHFGRYDEGVAEQLGIGASLTALYLGLLVFAAVALSRVDRLSRVERWLLPTYTVATLLLIFVGFYFTGTVPGLEFITGVQGRYFIPLAAPLLVWLSDLSGRGKERAGSAWLQWLGLAGVALALLSTTRIVLLAYYVRG